MTKMDSISSLKLSFCPYSVAIVMLTYDYEKVSCIVRHNLRAHSAHNFENCQPPPNCRKIFSGSIVACYHWFLARACCTKILFICLIVKNNLPIRFFIFNITKSFYGKHLIIDYTYSKNIKSNE